jgi:hypothetical protein
MKKRFSQRRKGAEERGGKELLYEKISLNKI